MREIKFRAWDKEYKKMRYLLRLLGHDEDGIYVNSFWNEDYGKLWTAGEDQFSDLMQYTSLKDKNGEEIYEGDIVKCGKFFWEIYYNDGMACFWCKNIYDDSFEDALFCLNYYKEKEVIGNIYGNPELLKG